MMRKIVVLLSIALFASLAFATEMNNTSSEQSQRSPKVPLPFKRPRMRALKL
jgi:hypothetical protein